MSSTNRAAERRPADNYPTPEWCTRLLLQELELPAGRWLEPAVGDGAIIRATGQVRWDVQWHALDIRDCGASERADFLTWSPPGRFDVAITNPPFSLAMDFILKGQSVAEHVVMLLRLNFLSSGKRSQFMRAHAPDVYILPNRPSFTGKGTDSIEYAWFHWPPQQRDRGSLRVLPALSVQERR